MLSQRDNVLALGELMQLPLGDCAVRSCRTFLKNMDGHDELKIAHRDVHLAFAHFVFGNLINERWQAPTHNVPPNFGPSITPLFAINFKPLTALNLRSIAGQSA